MELEIVNFEQAKELNILGFPQIENMQVYYKDYNDEIKCVHFDCLVSYLQKGGNPKEAYTAPPLELVAKWLREEKKYDINVSPVWQDVNFNPDKREYRFCITYKAKIVYGDLIHHLVYNTFEEALSKGIDKTIEILKEKQINRTC